MRFSAAMLVAGLVAATGLLCHAGDVSTEIHQAVKDLGHRKYKVRVTAGQHLETLAATNHVAVLQACLTTYQHTADPEVKWGAKAVLRRVVDQHLFRAPRGFLGVRLNNVILAAGGQLVMHGVTMPNGSLWIAEVLPETSAQQAGLQPNDFILETDGQRFEQGPGGFTEYIRSKSPGDKVKLTYVRAQVTNSVEAVLGKMPEADQQKLYTNEASEQFFHNWLRRQLELPRAISP